MGALGEYSKTRGYFSPFILFPVILSRAFLTSGIHKSSRSFDLKEELTSEPARLVSPNQGTSHRVFLAYISSCRLFLLASDISSDRV